MSEKSNTTYSDNQYPNIVKARDDHKPLRFGPYENQKFKLQEGSDATWIGTDEFGEKELRKHIEPWLTSLFQSEHLSLLLGSGLTHAVHFLATDKSAAGMGSIHLSVHQEKINGVFADQCG